MNAQNLPLRGMQLPEQVGFWPLAPGWWIMIALIILIPTVVILYRRWQQQRLSTISQQQLRLIMSQYETSNDGVQLAINLSELLRQVVISVYPRAHAASVTGENWLALLDKLGGCNEFSEGCGRQLLTCQYSNKPLNNPQELVTKISQWLNKAINQPVKGGLI